MAHRRACGLKELDLRSGSQRSRTFFGFFNVSDTALTFLYSNSRNRPIQSPFTTRWGYEGHILNTPPPPPGGNDVNYYRINNAPALAVLNSQILSVSTTRKNLSIIICNVENVKCFKCFVL